MPIDRDTSRRGVGWIKFILAAVLLFVVAVPVLMGIAGLRDQGGGVREDGDGTAPAETGALP